MISIQSSNQSDSAFLDLVSRACTTEARLVEAESVYVIEIDHCLDKKWRAFSGVIDLQCGTWWGPHLRVPPFHPNRVVRQTAYRNEVGSTRGYIIDTALPLHVRQSSYRNVHRHLRRIATRAVFVWYSGQTAVTSQGAVLVYRIAGYEEASWFASFSKDPWRIGRTHGISRRELNLLLSAPAAGAAPN